MDTTTQPARLTKNVRIVKDDLYGWSFLCYRCEQIFTYPDFETTQAQGNLHALTHITFDRDRAACLIAVQVAAAFNCRPSDITDEPEATFEDVTETPPVPDATSVEDVGDFPKYRYPTELPVGDVIPHYGHSTGAFLAKPGRHGKLHRRPTWDEIANDYEGGWME